MTELLERPLDSPLEQVSGLRARRCELGDPPLEHLGPRAELIEGQLDRARLEARRLRDLARGPSGQLGDRAPQQGVTLFGGQLAQARQERSEAFAAASADREQLDLVASEQVAQGRADELDRELAVGVVEVVDFVDHQQQPGDASGRLPKQFALGLRQRLAGVEHAERGVDPGEEAAGHLGVVRVNRPDPGGVDQLEPDPQQVVLQFDAGELHAQAVARIPRLGHVLGQLAERALLLVAVVEVDPQPVVVARRR